MEVRISGPCQSSAGKIEPGAKQADQKQREERPFLCLKYFFKKRRKSLLPEFQDDDADECGKDQARHNRICKIKRDLPSYGLHKCARAFVPVARAKYGELEKCRILKVDQ